MANPIWPASLPQRWLLADADESSDDKAVIRTPFETGPDQTRPRIYAEVRRFTGSVHLTGSQRVTFNTFWRTTIYYGALRFDWYDPVDAATLTLKILSWRARTIRPGVGASDAKLWLLTMQLETPL